MMRTKITKIQKINFFILICLSNYIFTSTEDISKDVNLIKSNKNKFPVAIIGIKRIDEIDTWFFGQQLLDVFKNPEISGIILAIESYGGSSNITYAIFSQIKTLKNYYKKPVVTFIDNVAFSGGYYIACAGDYIVASHGALVGSVGVRMGLTDYTKKDEKDKIKYTFIKSAQCLDLFSSHTKTEPGTHKMILDNISYMYNKFINDVLSSRPKAKYNRSAWQEAQLISAPKALSYGLIDQIGSQIEALNYIYAKTEASTRKQFSLESFDLHFVQLKKKKIKKQKLRRKIVEVDYITPVKI